MQAIYIETTYLTECPICGNPEAYYKTSQPEPCYLGLPGTWYLCCPECKHFERGLIEEEN